MNYYSVTDDFGGISPNILQLETEIQDYINNNPGNITPNYVTITKYLNDDFLSQDPFQIGDTIVNIIFDAPLSGGEKTYLDTIVSNHVPVTTISTSEIKTIMLTPDSITNSTYRRINKPFTFQGLSYATATSITYMDSGVTSYDIKIFDKTHNQILLVTNLTNTDETEQNLGTLTNLPSEPFILEFFVRKNGGNRNKKIYLESININYNPV